MHMERLIVQWNRWFYDACNMSSSFLDFPMFIPAIGIIFFFFFFFSLASIELYISMLLLSILLLLRFIERRLPIKVDTVRTNRNRCGRNSVYCVFVCDRWDSAICIAYCANVDVLNEMNYPKRTRNKKRTNITKHRPIAWGK